MTRIAWCVFGLLFTLAAIAAICFPASSVVSAYATNLATSILAIVLTVFLIDGAIQRQEAKRKHEMAALAFKRLRGPLGDHVRLWESVFKAALPAKPAILPADLRELLAPASLEVLKAFDIETPAPVAPPIQWTQHMLREFDVFHNRVDAVIDKYGFVLDPENIRALEAVGNSALITAFPAFLHLVIREPGRRSRVLAGVVEGRFEISPLVVDHLRALADLLDQYNSSVSERERIAVGGSLWTDTVAPMYGSSRHLRS